MPPDVRRRLRQHAPTRLETKGQVVVDLGDEGLVEARWRATLYEAEEKP